MKRHIYRFVSPGSAEPLDIRGEKIKHVFNCLLCQQHYMSCPELSKSVDVSQSCCKTEISDVYGTQCDYNFH